MPITKRDIIKKDESTLKPKSLSITSDPKYSSMPQALPLLTSEDFLAKWKEDRAELEKLRKEKYENKNKKD
jgi:hypothetical protein